MGCGPSTPEAPPQAAPAPAAAPAAPAAPSAEEVQALVEGFQAGYWNGKAVEMCTADAQFNAPGAPPMRIADMLGMVAPAKEAFPDWASLTHGAEPNDDGTWTVLTQQCCGAMQADLGPMGPFPAVALADADEKAKQDCRFPVEVGTYTLRQEDGAWKIQSGAFAGETRAVDGAEVSPDIDAMWNKNGDLSDVGFGAMFLLMGITLPPAPPAGGEGEAQ